MARGRGKSVSLTSWCFSSKLQPTIQQTQRVYMSSYFGEIVRGIQLGCNMTPPTCVSSPARPFASFCGCTQPCSFHSASPGSLPLGPACVSSPACSSAAGSQSELHPPLMDATRTGRYWVTEWFVFIIKEKNGDVQMSCKRE